VLDYNPCSFFRTFPIVYFKAKLKSNDNKASPCFRPLSIGNTSEKLLPMRTLLYEGVSKSFWTGRLEQELQMVQLSATRCSCIAIL
jgi:hypothetical protein